MKKIIFIFIIALFLLSGCEKTENTDLSGLTVAQLGAQGMKIGVATGSKADNVVREQFPAAEVMQYATVGEGFVAVKTGKIDAFCYDRAVMLHTVAENPDLALLDEVIAQNDLAVGIRDELSGLTEDVNAVIRKLTDDGTIEEMKARWLEGDPNPFMPEIPSAMSPDRTLIIGTSHENRPMCYLDADGNPTGFDVEFARRLAFELGFGVEFRVMDWPALIPSLKSGKIDMIAATLNTTEERKQNMALSDPYVYADIVMLVRRQDVAVLPPSYRAEDFAGKRIGIMTGSTYDLIVDDAIENAEKLYFQSSYEIGEALQNGKADGALCPETVAREMVSRYSELVYLSPSVKDDDYGALFSKESGELATAFNDFLAELKTTPLYHDMEERWIHSPEAPAMPDISSGGSKGVQKLATAAEDKPFSYIRDGEITGFDIELAYRFAAHMDMALEITMMDFTAMFPAVKSGKADFACSMITITEERAQSFNSSDPYYRSGVVMVIHGAQMAGAETQTFWESVKASFYQNLIVENRWRLVTDGLRVTMIISILAMALGTLLGFLICLMTLSKLKILNIAAKVYTALLRGTPIVVLLMIIFYIIFAKVNISPVLVAVIAFGLNAGAFVGGLAHTAILTVDKGQIEAARSIGFGSVGAFFLVTLPQAMKVALPVYKAEFVSLVKATAVVGYIAIMDLTKAGDIIRSRTYDAFFPLLAVAAVYFIITGAFILLFGRIEKLADKRGRRNKI